MSKCLFCRIIADQIPAERVFEDDQVLAFRDVAPKAPVHVLVVPKSHVSDLGDVNDSALAAALLSACSAVAEGEGVAATGYRVVVNRGDNGGQSVDHLHFHVLGGRPMRWPPG